MEFCSDFKWDLKFGNEFEGKLGEIFNNKKIEVKTDKYTKKTGNVCIEVKSRGKPSGLSTTQAEYWAYVIFDKDDEDGFNHISLIKVERLKKIVKKFWEKTKKGEGNFVRWLGDNNTSLCVLVPFNELAKGL